MDIEDFDSLTAYLRRNGHIGAQETVTARILTGGVSNRAVWVDLASGESWVLKQALEKLRQDMGVEGCAPPRVSLPSALTLIPEQVQHDQ